jgi:Na+/H+ antiporter NhaD/arsenite permease-like protein
MYLTIGTLFVNISIGGALTSFAAPPILMVTSAWNWDTAYVFQTFGIKATIAVFINTFILTLVVYKELPEVKPSQDNESMPSWVVFTHLLFLLAVVIFAHHAVVFMGFLLFFLGYTHAYSAYQTRLILKEALMVAFFLAGLVILGGLQQWWLQPLLSSMSNTAVFYGATALTAITDNAALTYLGSLVEGTSEEFRYALVAGALAGGGLTVIANAPNPAGLAILKDYFPQMAVSAGKLFLASLPSTVVAIIAFQLL